VDPDPHGSAQILVVWVRIQEGNNDPQKLRKEEKFHVLKCWMFSFEGLNVLLGINKYIAIFDGKN
jgi:hypothetical protein